MSSGVATPISAVSMIQDPPASRAHPPLRPVGTRPSHQSLIQCSPSATRLHISVRSVQISRLIIWISRTMKDTISINNKCRQIYYRVEPNFFSETRFRTEIWKVPFIKLVIFLVKVVDVISFFIKKYKIIFCLQFLRYDTVKMYTILWHNNFKTKL